MADAPLKCPHCGTPLPDARGIVADSAARTVTRAGHTIWLSPMEFDVFFVLLSRFGRTVPRDKLMMRLYGSTGGPETPTSLNVWMSLLRKSVRALELEIPKARYGAGWMLRTAQATDATQSRQAAE